MRNANQLKVLRHLANEPLEQRHFRGVERGTAVKSTSLVATFAALRTEGLVEVSDVGNRKLYALTEAGRAEVSGGLIALPDSARILTFFNHAGGAAKTSSARDIGYELAQLGYAVLLIDHDPQASLTRWLGVDTWGVERDATLYPVLAAKGPLPTPLEVQGLALIPATVDLVAAEGDLQQDPFAFMRLRKALEKAPHYDFILIDAPPVAGRMALSAAYAAQRLVVPIPVVRKGLDGLESTQDLVQSLQSHIPGFGVLLYIPTQFDANVKASQETLEQMRLRLPHVSPPLLRRPAAYNGAQLEGVPLGVYRPSDEARTEVQAVVNFLLTSLGLNPPTSSPLLALQGAG